MTRVAVICITALVVTSAPGSIRADVLWTAPPECPGSRAFRAAVHGHAGRVVPAPVQVTARRIGRAWEVKITYDGKSRVLIGDSCQDVFDAAALVVGLAWRAVPVRAQTRAPPALPQMLPPPAPSAIPNVRRIAIARESSPTTFHWLLAVSVGPDLGSLSRVVPALSARGGFGSDRLSLQLGINYAVDASAPASAMPGTNISGRLLSGDLHACGGVGWAWLCGGIELGAVTLQAQSGEATDTGTGAWLAAHAGPIVRWRLPRALTLISGLHAVVPLVSPRFVIDGTLVQRSSEVSARAFVGIEALFR